MSDNVLTAKIWNEPRYRDAYLARLLDVADLLSSNWFERQAQREYEVIRDAAYADPLTPFSREEFDEANAFVQQFARERGGVVRQYVRSVAPEVINGSSRSLNRRRR
jgi:hypothetical protein